MAIAIVGEGDRHVINFAYYPLAEDEQ